jgi:type II secretory pathway pseudopilin PulG
MSAHAVWVRLRGEAGMTLAEILMACALLIVVLGAALAPFEVLNSSQRRTENQNDSQDSARNAVTQITRNLRNTSGQNRLVNRADPYDLVIETVDPTGKPSGSQNSRNLMRVRYCLDTGSDNTAGLTNGRIWEQAYRWTTSTPPDAMPGAGCPDATWGTRRVVTEWVTNKATSGWRPTAAALFTYFPSASPLDTITSVRVRIYSDRKWSEEPRETELTSGILLRNQNGAPTASFTATPETAGSAKITLNASYSSDPEGLPLTYRWCDVTTNATCDDTTKIGTGVLYTYTAPAAGPRSIKLQVTDIGGLTATAGPLSVTAP